MPAAGAMPAAPSSSSSTRPSRARAGGVVAGGASSIAAAALAPEAWTPPAPAAHSRDAPPPKRSLRAAPSSASLTPSASAPTSGTHLRESTPGVADSAGPQPRGGSGGFLSRLRALLCCCCSSSSSQQRPTSKPADLLVRQLRASGLLADSDVPSGLLLASHAPSSGSGLESTQCTRFSSNVSATPPHSEPSPRRLTTRLSANSKLTPTPAGKALPPSTSGHTATPSPLLVAINAVDKEKRRSARNANPRVAPSSRTAAPSAPNSVAQMDDAQGHIGGGVGAANMFHAPQLLFSISNGCTQPPTSASLSAPADASARPISPDPFHRQRRRGDLNLSGDGTISPDSFVHLHPTDSPSHAAQTDSTCTSPQIHCLFSLPSSPAPSLRGLHGLPGAPPPALDVDVAPRQLAAPPLTLAPASHPAQPQTPVAAHATAHAHVRAWELGHKPPSPPDRDAFMEPDSRQPEYEHDHDHEHERDFDGTAGASCAEPNQALGPGPGLGLGHKSLDYGHDAEWAPFAAQPTRESLVMPGQMAREGSVSSKSARPDSGSEAHAHAHAHAHTHSHRPYPRHDSGASTPSAGSGMSSAGAGAGASAHTRTSTALEDYRSSTSSSLSSSSSSSSSFAHQHRVSISTAASSGMLVAPVPHSPRAQLALDARASGASAFSTPSPSPPLVSPEPAHSRLASHSLAPGRLSRHGSGASALGAVRPHQRLQSSSNTALQPLAPSQRQHVRMPSNGNRSSLPLIDADRHRAAAASSSSTTQADDRTRPPC